MAKKVEKSPFAVTSGAVNKIAQSVYAVEHETDELAFLMAFCEVNNDGTVPKRDKKKYATGVKKLKALVAKLPDELP